MSLGVGRPVRDRVEGEHCIAFVGQIEADLVCYIPTDSNPSGVSFKFTQSIVGREVLRPSRDSEGRAGAWIPEIALKKVTAVGLLRDIDPVFID